MSKIGKHPVAIPAGVTASVDGQTVKVKGPKGALEVILVEEIQAKLEGSELQVTMRGETSRHKSMWGMSRTLVSNLVEGVTKGFEKKLEITGVGYKAAVQGKVLNLSLGYSHDVLYTIPEGIQITAPKPTELVVAGINKQQVGQVAAEIRDFRGPEPYKGKGVKYAGEFIFRKEGKKK
ncbi:50S ribosomal protein L6 [Xanthobacteraceae bacterium A53D]